MPLPHLGQQGHGRCGIRLPNQGSVDEDVGIDQEHYERYFFFKYS